MDQIVIKRVAILEGQIFATLTECFKKSHPNVRTIIDWFEVFLETPSSL